MDKERMMELLVENLERGLKPFIQKEVEGLRHLDDILEDMDEEFFSETTIFRNKQFVLTFDKKDRKLLFLTTFSNQTIDNNYINEVNFIHQNKMMVEFTLRSIMEVKFGK